MSPRVHVMPFGAAARPGGVRFRLWAPGCDTLSLAIAGREDLLPMQPEADGWFELDTDQAGPGTLYQFVLPDGLRVPDPASRHQPQDAHGPSEVIDPAATDWTGAIWSGRPWHEAIIYELHVGTFTAEGTFRAAIDKLDHLVSLGITVIEIMPLADFPGRWNWGYDGVLLYAPDSSYGRPEDLKALVQAAHARGISVMLDVVYNHFGPDGNYIGAYVPHVTTERHSTPWGAAINYDGEHSAPLREFVIHNVLYWIAEFDLDGMRFDAIHAIIDDSPKHLLDEIADRARALRGDRPLHLVLENEHNWVRFLERTPDGAPQLYTGQWNDDVHHALHVAATGERSGYYAEYHGDSEMLGRAVAEGFGFQGGTMEYSGTPRGEPSGHLPPSAFVAFIQNHDHIGNRAFGDRIGARTPSAALHAIAAVYLLLPQIPMLFMGEEWAASQPFPFFVDFSGDLAEAIRTGRLREFARFPEFKDEAVRATIPDPTAPETFNSAKLRWDQVGDGEHGRWLDWYRRIIAVRTQDIVPLLPRIRHGGQYRVLAPGALAVHWTLDDGGGLSLLANLSGIPVTAEPPQGRIVWREGSGGQGGDGAPWAVRWSVTDGGVV